MIFAWTEIEPRLSDLFTEQKLDPEAHFKKYARGLVGLPRLIERLPVADQFQHSLSITVPT